MRTVVSLTFDDGLASHHAMLPILRRHAAPATFFVNSGKIGLEGYLDWAQLEQLAAEGHEIGGHTRDHVELTTLPDPELQDQIAADRAALLDRGISVVSFAYPFGAYDADVCAAVEASGYQLGRRSWGLADEGVRDRPRTESLPPADRYAARTVPSIESTKIPQRLERLVADAERVGGWLPFVFHDVDDLDGFERFVDWLAKRQFRGTSVARVADVIADAGTAA